MGNFLEENKVTMTLAEYLAYADAVKKLERIEEECSRLIAEDRTYMLDGYIAREFGIKKEAK